MNFQTIILRFRDLVTGKGETIANHKKLLKAKALFGGHGGAKEMRKFPFRNSQHYVPMPKVRNVHLLYIC